LAYLKTYLDAGLIGVLGFMSFLTLTFTIERYLYFARLDVTAFERVEDLEIALTRHLTVIASVGANAPYMGLLGTVLGILVTFHDIGQGGTIDTSTIMVGLAMALKATALGLLVAMPSIVFYNALLRKVEVIKACWGRRIRH
jgi:biopolymer transport protein ExbB